MVAEMSGVQTLQKCSFKKHRFWYGVSVFYSRWHDTVKDDMRRWGLSEDDAQWRSNQLSLPYRTVTNSGLQPMKLHICDYSGLGEEGEKDEKAS